MPTKLQLSIAGFTIELRSQYQLSLGIGYTHFYDTAKKAPDLTIDCLPMDNSPIPREATHVFSSANSELRFYDIYRLYEVLYFEIHDQNNQTEIQQFARLEPDLKHWTVWSREENGTLDPMLFPMGPIIFHYAVLTTEAVMMHASAIFDGEKGRMFSGFSGAGKSTIAGIWHQAGNNLINDDRLIIRREGEQYFVYNTPMYYEDGNKKAPLHAIYLIYHSPENKIEQLKGVVALSSVMAFSIQNNYDKRFVQHHIDFFHRLSQNLTVYRLGVVPDMQIIDFIKASD